MKNSKKFKKNRMLLYKVIRRVADLIGILLLVAAILFAAGFLTI